MKVVLNSCYSFYVDFDCFISLKYIKSEVLRSTISLILSSKCSDSSKHSMSVAYFLHLLQFAGIIKMLHGQYLSEVVLCVESLTDKLSRCIIALQLDGVNFLISRLIIYHAGL